MPGNSARKTGTIFGSHVTQAELNTPSRSAPLCMPLICAMDWSSDSLLASICWMAGINFFGGGGQRDAAFRAGEQRKAALGLNAGHGMADGGRRDVHTLRRRGEGAQLRDDAQQLAVCQGHSLHLLW